MVGKSTDKNNTLILMSNNMGNTAIPYSDWWVHPTKAHQWNPSDKDTEREQLSFSNRRIVPIIA
jgi:hypothetical protein